MLLKEALDMNGFNRALAPVLAGRRVDFGSLFLWNLEKNLSVIAKHTPPRRFAVLDEQGNHAVTEGTDFYYGASPLLDNKLIIESISSLQLSDAERLDAFVIAHHDLFMLHEEQRELLPHMARYIILAMAGNFGVAFRQDSRLTALLAEAGCSNALFCREKEDRLILKGCPPAPLLALLGRYRYRKQADLWEICQGGEGLTVEEIYADKQSIGIVSGKVFYSGALLKPVKLTMLDNVFENCKTATLCFEFERSTFATVFALDGNFLRHPLLSSEARQAISSLLYRDDRCKKELIEALAVAEGEEKLTAIDRYLKDTANVNQIGVSANVVTSDRLLLLSKRASETIDSGALYPGVNGNAEVTDRQVSFYKYSVYEDFPTIDPAGTRLDFLGEITREAYAELQLAVNKQSWSTVGVCISGNRPGGKKSLRLRPVRLQLRSAERTAEGRLYTAQKRRMHFNILFEATVDESYEQVLVGCERAEESFENEKLPGLRIKCHRNRFSAMLGFLGESVRLMVNSKDLIEALLLLVLSLGALFTAGAFDRSTTNLVSLFLATAVLMIYAGKLVKGILKCCRIGRLQRSVSIYKSRSAAQNAAAVNRLLRDYECHPVCCIAVSLFVRDRLYRLLDPDHEKKKPKKSKSKRPKKTENRDRA